MAEPQNRSEQNEPLEKVMAEPHPKATVDLITEALGKAKEVPQRSYLEIFDATDDKNFEQIVTAFELRQTGAYKSSAPSVEESPPSAVLYTTDENINIWYHPETDVDPMELTALGHGIPADTRVVKHPEKREIYISNGAKVDRSGNEFDNPKGITVPTAEILAIASK